MTTNYTSYLKVEQLLDLQEPRGEPPEHAEMRFNVGCVNASDTATRVSFELYRSDGTLLATESLILMRFTITKM